MNLGHFHEKLTSLAVSVVLTSAFLASPPRAVSATGSAEVGAPQSAAAASSEHAVRRSLTPDQQRKLAELMTAHGHDVAMSALVTAALGIGKDGEVLTMRQLTVNEHPNLHTYIPLSDGGFWLSFVDTAASWNYRVDANFRLIGAVRMDGRMPVVIPRPDAELSVQTEIAYWADVADNP
jgi:hypothetical protein